MKKYILFTLLIVFLIGWSCKKEEEQSQRFNYLTGNIWASDTLFANGVDASGPGQMLEKFKGEALFNEDGTGVFGNYTGEWNFNSDETRIKISSDSLLIPLTTDIVELTNLSLKITTAFPNVINPEDPTAIRMTFNAK